jgi:hypothetical protein
VNNLRDLKLKGSNQEEKDLQSLGLSNIVKRLENYDTYDTYAVTVEESRPQEGEERADSFAQEQGLAPSEHELELLFKFCKIPREVTL